MYCWAAEFGCVIMSSLNDFFRISSNVSKGFDNVGLVKLEIKLPLNAIKVLKCYFFIFKIKKHKGAFKKYFLDKILDPSPYVLFCAIFQYITC